MSGYGHNQVSHIYPAVYASGNANVHLGDRVEIHQNPRETLIASLRFPEIFERYDSIEKNHGSSCEWILRPASGLENTKASSWDSFLSWLQSSEQIYWISGKPGSGKSTLVKYLVDNVESTETFKQLKTVVLSFWFWEAGKELQKSWKGCLRSLLCQLLDSSVSLELPGDMITSLKRPKMQSYEKYLTEALFDMLELLQAQEVSCVIFLDGLDESGQESRKILKSIYQLIARVSTLKICLSSREEQLFVDSFSMRPRLRLQDLNEGDIEEIIQVDFLLDTTVQKVLARDIQTANELKSALKRKADGVILWLKIAINSLTRGITNRDTITLLRARLEELPGDLESLYTQMLSRGNIDEARYQEDAASYLKLILVLSSMSLIQFCVAINAECRQKFLTTPFSWESIDLSKAIDHENVIVWLSARTGGLLEVFSSANKTGLSNSTPLQNLTDRSAQTRAIFMMTRSLTVQLIHRTARTFLYETVQGRDLLSRCPWSTTDQDSVLLESSLVADFIIPYLSSFEYNNDLTDANEFPLYDFVYDAPPEYSLDIAELVWHELQVRGYLPVVPYLEADYSVFRQTKYGNIDMLALCFEHFWCENVLARLSAPRLSDELLDSNYMSRLLWLASKDLRASTQRKEINERMLLLQQCVVRLIQLGANNESTVGIRKGEAVTLGQLAFPIFWRFPKWLKDIYFALFATSHHLSTPQISGALKRWTLMPWATDLESKVDMFGTYSWTDHLHIKWLGSEPEHWTERNKLSKISVCIRSDMSKPDFDFVLVSDENSEKILHEIRKINLQDHETPGESSFDLPESGILQYDTKIYHKHPSFRKLMSEVFKRSKSACFYDAMLYLGKDPDIVAGVINATRNEAHNRNFDEDEKIGSWMSERDWNDLIWGSGEGEDAARKRTGTERSSTNAPTT